MMKGFRHSEETKKKIRESRMGKTSGMKGKKHSKATKKKMSEVHINTMTEELKTKISESNKGRIFSDEHKNNLKEAKIRMSMEQQGVTNIKDWNGFTSDVNKRIRRSPEYKEWRDKVFKRDDYTCQKCKKRSGKGVKVYLHAHHIMPFINYPSYRFLEEFGQTLCVDCHLWQHQEIGKPKRSV